MIRSYLLFVFLLTLSMPSWAQFGFEQQDNSENPSSWEASVVKKSDSIFTVIISASIDESWHLPSQIELKEDENGPIPTEFNFEFDTDRLEKIGSTREPEGITKFDEIFKTDLTYFENEVTFEQDVKVKAKEATLDLEILFMICNDEMCLPQDQQRFSFTVEASKLMLTETKAIEVKSKDKSLTEALKLDLKGESEFKMNSEEDQDSNFTIFLLGFVGGLIALLTPCVFPMIPLTVSFFTKGARTKKLGLINAIMYGAFIFLIYLLLSLPFHLIDSVNPEILNSISTNPVLNVVFFVIFLVFAFSFFGYYEITLPNSWSSKLDQKATSVGGIIGIFFMALTLALVSFSCTGPILGSLLGGSLTADGGATMLTFGMGGFGLALALPFALFALFPNWLNSLPKSGGWLNTVKVVLGFLELGLAFKFLSNADLVEHWGILKREVFLGIWILIGLAMVLYLFGKIRFPHDSPLQKLSKGRLIVGVLTLAFVVYLIPGLTNSSHANLKLLSGFPPPLFYSLYEKETDGPLGLKAYKDFDEGLKAAKAENKPILLDFTGWACVNCRKMEEQVWSVPEVFKIIQDDYILISLYVDDKAKLSEDERFNFERKNGSVKKIRTIGDKWATFQTLNFRNNSQPYYVLLSDDLDVLNETIAYEPSYRAYLSWLETGLENYNNKKDRTD
ncbi:protein-disulfide reductase DsbD family protein [Psychroflexus montanilacus]|uniref:protein-disulfide reductase DsbD family protein n=1 Tax=Psychroflexus montanilacus TaxID=2873598 RepID=UPI001CCF3857|nr:cytochrome c biogenesis protein CcdA [Psychroflexus montanilacus]MBZ9653027.1 thioredoxin family protein [Psychroflexus montanilacus]